MGMEVRKEPEESGGKRSEFLTGDIKLDPQFSPDYMFDFFGKIHGVKPEKLKERKEELFTYFGIKDFAHKKMKELSTGMGRRLQSQSAWYMIRILLFLMNRQTVWMS